MIKLLYFNIEEIPKYKDILALLRVNHDIGYDDMIAYLIDEDRCLGETYPLEEEKIFFSKDATKKLNSILYQMKYMESMIDTKVMLYKTLSESIVRYGIENYID